jgi:hypothetical protein
MGCDERDVMGKAKHGMGHHLCQELAINYKSLYPRMIHSCASSSVSSCSSPLWLGAVNFFRPPFFAFPIISHHRCPFTPVEPGYGVDLFEDDYLFLLPAADLRTTHRDFFYLRMEQFVFVFCGLGRSGEV